MTTSIHDIGGGPMQINPAGHALGDPGRSVRLTNAGDDVVHWWIAAAAPSGVPGFPIRRGGSHEITLPSLPLWAWARGSSRLLVTPLGNDDDIGVIPETTSAVTLGQTPVAVAAPQGAEEGTQMLAVAAGEPVYSVLGTDTSPPTPLTPETTLKLGGTANLVGGPDGGATAWWWTDRHAGATLLLTVADGRWTL